MTNANDLLNDPNPDTDYNNCGLTKREYFAGLAMQAIVSSDVRDTVETIAEGSVSMADALIEALNK